MRDDGGYQLLRELARGARARVFLASDGRNVEAVKVHPIGDEGRADREYRVGRDLLHPHLVRVLRRTGVEGAPAVAMAFVPGERLGPWARQASLEARLDAIDGLLAGLQALHARGFVHRDVKPENVVIGERDRPVLLDYDLAVAIGDERDARSTAGTPIYLSPEQARGEPAGPASDLYAVGVLLYRWLTGELPFLGAAPEVIASHREASPLPPSAVDPALRRFDVLVGKLLEKRPEARFADAEEVRAALRSVRRG
jgi:serine/threonine protein kinase